MLARLLKKSSALRLAGHGPAPQLPINNIKELFSKEKTKGSCAP
jgi:hypothetical protein